MPSNREFGFQILIAGQPVPEYEKDGEYFVECNLNTPYSYKEKVIESIRGETEAQEYPVTPYQIKIMTYQSGQSYYRVLVDGVKVKGLALENTESTVIKGFRDGHFVREFLFSLPRFARNENDRVNAHRIPNIGKVTIEAWLATHRTTERCMRRKNLSFEQANKKDSSAVTKGSYVMATSRAGKVVCGRSVVRNVDSWKLVSLRSTLSVKYHMAHTLQEMGFTLKAMTFSKPMPSTSRSGSRKWASRTPVKEEDSFGEPSQKRKKTSHNKGTSASASRNMQMLRDAADSLLALHHKSTYMRVSSSARENEEISVIGVRDPVMKNQSPDRQSPILIDLTEDDEGIGDVTSVTTGDSEVKVNVVKVDSEELRPSTSTKQSAGEDNVKKRNDVPEVMVSPDVDGVSKEETPVAHKEADSVVSKEATAPGHEASPAIQEKVASPVCQQEVPVSDKEGDSVVNEEATSPGGEEVPPELNQEAEFVADKEVAPAVGETAEASGEEVSPVTSQATTSAADLMLAKSQTGGDASQSSQKNEDVESLLADSGFQSLGSPGDVSNSVLMETTDNVGDRDSLLDGSSST